MAVDPNVIPDLNTAMELFDDQVTLQFQNHKKLDGVIEERHGTQGDGTNVPVSDLIEMQEESFAAQNIPITPVVPTNKLIEPNNFRVKTVIGGAEKTLYNFSKIVDHSRLQGMAAGRMDDFIKLDSIYSSPAFNNNNLTVIPKTVGPHTGMNQEKISNAMSVLEDNGVDVYMDMSMWLPAVAKRGLMVDNTFTNYDFNDSKPLTDYREGTPQGLDIRVLGSAGINTVPFTTSNNINTYLVPIVSKNAIVQIYNRDIQTKIDYKDTDDRWELLTVMTSGAKIIQTEGIVLIEVDNPISNN